MTGWELARFYHGKILKHVRFRFFGSNHWWDEYWCEGVREGSTPEQWIATFKHFAECQEVPL